LIEDLRVVSLADSGHLELQVREADLSSEIKAVVDIFEDTLRSSGQQPVLDLDERRVCCDPVRIRQALLALLENARRHAVPGTIRIQTRIDQGRCYLRVADEGPGIAPEFVHHVFKEFWRAEESRSRERGGSGLGLAVVSAIARAHGGRATCTSAPGSGTVFELSWPTL
jgi:two-component system sensor histidine kinase AdeS